MNMLVIVYAIMVKCTSKELTLQNGELKKMTKEKNKTNDNKVSNKLNQANDLKAWQNGTLINDNAINKLSLKELNKINDMLTKAGY